MLKVENVTKFYDDFKAVDNLSFDVKPGEIFGLLGDNGAGKTTTFRMITGLLKPSSGKITLDGHFIDYDITDKIGFLTEEQSLLTKMTVKQHAIYYGTLKNMKEKDILNRLDELLKKFKIEDYKDKKIKELSKGNRQKIQFIMAIINNPKLLILDEPFSGLDPFNTEMFKNEIKLLAKNGSIIIFSSHRLEHVELFCKKLLVLKNGKNILSGDLEDIKHKYRKKNIEVIGNIDIEKIKQIKGVIQVTLENNKYKIKIQDESIIDEVFNIVKKGKNISKFSVEEPSLNEIFIEKVGETYDE